MGARAVARFPPGGGLGSNARKTGKRQEKEAVLRKHYVFGYAAGNKSRVGGKVFFNFFYLFSIITENKYFFVMFCFF